MNMYPPQSDGEEDQFAMSPEPPEQEEEETTAAEGWNSCDSNHLLLAYYMYMYVHMYLLATQYDNLNINFIEIQRNKRYHL